MVVDGLGADALVAVAEGSELVVVVLEDVGVDRPDGYAVVGGVCSKVGEVIHAVPGDMEGDARRDTGVGVYLSGVFQLFIGGARYAAGGEHFKPCARVSERPGGEFDGLFLKEATGVRGVVAESSHGGRSLLVCWVTGLRWHW